MIRWSKLKWLVVIGSGLLALLWGLNVIIRPLEPHYEGMPLRYWVHRLHIPRIGNGAPYSEGFDQKTREALKAIGQRATPWLIRWLDSPDVPFVDPLIERIWRKLSDPQLRGSLAPGHYLAAPGAYWRACSLDAFAMCEASSTNAVPAIITRLQDEKWWIRMLAAEALARFPSQKQVIVPALIAAIDDPESQVVFSTLYSLQQLGTNTAWYVPFISSLTNHAFPEVRYYGAKCLEFMSTNVPPVPLSPPLLAPVTK